jgi:hypothetical protein
MAETNFRMVYDELLQQFKSKLNDAGLDIKNLPPHLPAPFLPDFGSKYKTTRTKFAFIGQDSNYNTNLSPFLNDEDPLKFSDIINFNDQDPEAFPEFLHYTKGNSFWNFVLKFLALHYNIPEWNLLTTQCNNSPNAEILRSFVHGNVHSIPQGYPGLEESKGVDLATWEKVKSASKVFDKLDNIIKAFNPKVIILMYWHAPDDWFSGELGTPEKFDPIKLWYYYIESSQTHLYWTYHPSGMRNPVDPEEILSTMMNSIKEKEIFQS